MINTKNIKEVIQEKKNNSFNTDKKNDKISMEKDNYKIRKNFYNINRKENSNEISRNVSTMNFSSNEKRKSIKLNNKSNKVIKIEKNNLDESNKVKSNKNFFKLDLKEKEAKDDNITKVNQGKENKDELCIFQNFKKEKMNNLLNYKKKEDINSIQKFNLNNNKIYNNIKIKKLSIYKNIKNNIIKNKNEKNINYKNMNNKNDIDNYRMGLKHNEIENANKIISSYSNNMYSINYKINNKHKLKSCDDSIASKVTVLSRNKIILKNNSKTISKLFLLDSGYSELNNSSKNKRNKIIKSNLSHSYKRSNKSNLLNNTKFNNIPIRLTRNISIFRKSPINRNNSCLNFLINYNKIDNNNYFSRTRNNIKIFKSNFLGVSLASSLSQSKSKIKENEKNISIMKSSNFMTKSVDNFNSNRFRINNLKVQRIISPKNKIKGFLNNLNIFNRNIDIRNLNANSQNIIKSTFRKNKKKRN